MDDDEMRQENASRLLSLGEIPPWDTRLRCVTPACHVLTYLYGRNGSCPGCRHAGVIDS